MIDLSTTVPGAEYDTESNQTISSAVRHTKDDALCPVCGTHGKVVPGQTVKALLSVSLRRTEKSEYRFCRTQSCPVVYFGGDRNDLFTIDQVRERIYHKAPEDASVYMCYCFHHTVGDVHIASAETHAAMLADIADGIRAGQCACDLRNPQGVCCLGTIRERIKGMQS